MWRFVMDTVNNVANFNGQRAVIDPGDAVLLLIGHQSGLFAEPRQVSESEPRQVS